MLECENFQREFAEIGYEVYTFGSTVNGLLTRGSDLDLTIVVGDCLIDQEKVLDKARGALIKFNSLNGPARFKIINQLSITAGWLLEVDDNLHGLHIDILVNKWDGIKNSELICQYAMADSRLPAIMHTLKAWNRHYFGKLEPFQKLNSFTLSLMLVAYMQSEKILPNLQALSRTNVTLTKLSVIKDGEKLVDALNTSFEETEELLAKF